MEGVGLVYSYEIYAPAQNVTGTLVALTEPAPTTRRVPLALTVPGGAQVVVPFTPYAVLEFAAATSGMSSRMFERSVSVRAEFTGLAATIGGVCCLLDIETDVFQICRLNGQSMQDPAFAATWPG